jgi:hypothetical protein
MIAKVNGLAAKLPPSVRDFEIYRFVKFECNSTREAAHEFHLSQTRVRQVMARVIEFLIESAPHGDDDEEGASQRLYVAEQLAREQLDYLYQRAMKAFDDTHHEDIHGNLLPGKVSYLAAAARITLWMAKVPVHALPEFREDEEENAREEAACAPIDHSDPEVQRQTQELREWLTNAKAEAQADADASREQARLKFAAESAAIRQQVEAEREARRAARAERASGPAGTAPPNAACSLEPVSSGDSAHPRAQASAVKVPADGTYRTLDEIKAAARKRFLSTAQTADDALLGSPVPGNGNGSGNGDGERDAEHHDEPRRPLNRHQRRARERMRQRALAKR